MVRVLVVDDFESFRRFVASQLGKRPEVQIVGEASDGLEAVKKAEELEPELILLDIGLPKLNGIEAARRIRKRSPSSKILFFSQDSSVDTVQEALKTGAAGYVVKSDAGRELLTAVDTVLRDEQFLGSRYAGHSFSLNERQNRALVGAPVMMIADSQINQHFAQLTPQKANGGPRHEVHFYSKEESLQNRLAHFVGSALKAGNAAIVVATEPHRKELLLRLAALGLDVHSAQEQGAYISVDAPEALSTFIVDGMADSVRFQELFGNLIATAVQATRKEQARVAVYGECVHLLWAQGNAEAAIQMEKLGNQLVKTYGIDILCGYSLTSFHGQPGTEMFQRICAEHSAVYCG
jgi:DNA-binding NarL/FixJ family response regulator